MATDWEDAAHRYCCAKLKHNALKREIRECVCERQAHARMVPACWLDDGVPWCDPCRRSAELVKQRRAIGRTIPGLAVAMYREFAKELGRKAPLGGRR